MTPRTRTILSVISAFVIGGVAGGAAGGYSAARFTGWFFGDGWMFGKSVDIQTRIEILKSIRTGNINKGTEMLEIFLDADIMSLSEAAPDNSATTNASIRKAIAIARDYRATYPRHTDQPSVDAAVARVVNNNAKP